MRVGLDVKTLALHGGGIATFIQAVLPKLTSSYDDVEFIAFGPAAALAKMPARVQRVQVELWRGIGGLRLPVYDQWQLRRAATRSALDVLFSPYFDAPVGMRIATVVTMHDAVHLRYPDLYPRSHRMYYQNLMRIHGGRAAAIVTDSEFSKSELAELAGIRPDRIHVVPLALLPNFASARAAEPAILRRYNLPSQYVLYAGGVEARKNVSGLLSAYGTWRARRPEAPPLVLTGDAGRYASYADGIAQLGAGQGVFMSGRVADDDMPDVYAGAVAVIYPSLYEGFGFPLLEAMSCGVPITCSRRGSLPEVGGDAALYFDPSDIDDIIDCLDRVASDEEIRAALVARGIARVKEYSLDRTTAALASVIMSAADYGI